MKIRALRDDDAEAFLELRRAALLDAPLAFTASPEDDLVATPEVFREQIAAAPETVILGAFDGRLIGIAGLYRETHLKAAHKAHLWGMYVLPEHRGRGVGTGLLDALVSHARRLTSVTSVHLSVTSAAPEARKLYESRGFRVWGTEPDSLRHDGRTVVEHHLVLDLD
jgi:ribosomal protein S18 acetylase RimI-like enzyme